MNLKLTITQIQIARSKSNSTDFNSPVYTLPEIGASGDTGAMNLKADEIPF